MTERFESLVPLVPEDAQGAVEEAERIIAETRHPGIHQKYEALRRHIRRILWGIETKAAILSDLRILTRDLGLTIDVVRPLLDALDPNLDSNEPDNYQKRGKNSEKNKIGMEMGIISLLADYFKEGNKFKNNLE